LNLNPFDLFTRERLTREKLGEREWDLFVSAFNPSERVRIAFETVRAREKIWLGLPEYRLSREAVGSSGVIWSDEGTGEAGSMIQLADRLEERGFGDVLVDVTGFIPAYLMTLVAVLWRRGVQSFDALYSEPVRYKDAERTQFSDGVVSEVRQVEGFEGLHETETREDLLVIGAGYDSRVIAEVANAKEHCSKVQMFGFPSVRPDMFQEAVLRASSVSEAVGPVASDPARFVFAPAYDPFVTAAMVEEIVCGHRQRCPRSNVYLAPLATKAQALGFALYYIFSEMERPTSIILPRCRCYMSETSEGFGGAWVYRVEFPESVVPHVR
jgi:hypothetical protein